MDIITINELVGVQNNSNPQYKDNEQKIDMIWLWDTLIIEDERDHIYWFTTEGNRSTYFINDDKGLLKLVSSVPWFHGTFDA